MGASVHVHNYTEMENRKDSGNGLHMAYSASKKLGRITQLFQKLNN